MRLLSTCLALGLCAAIASPAVGQTKDRLDRRDKLLGWESVGRLDTRGGHCTAALIARDVVLTAAHCVTDARGVKKGMVFRAGYSDGLQIAQRKVTDVVVAEGYQEARNKGDTSAYVSRDVALLRLESAIFDPGAEPYELAEVPRRNAALTLASYGRGRLEALTLEQGCALQSIYRGGVVGIDCDATFGSSGAPVFVEIDGRPRIFSLVSSGVVNEDGGSETLGVELSRIVPRLMAELREMRALTPISNGARRIGVGQRSTEGARFIRPSGS